MAEYKIAVIPGDGIGIEVMAEGIKVLNAIADKSRHQMGLCGVPLGLRLLFQAWAHDATGCA